MSKFIEKLKQVSQPPVRPMGFGARTVTSRTRLQLLAHIGTASLASQTEGADAIAIASFKKSYAEKIKGVWLKKGELSEVDQAIENEADFVVLPANGEAIPPGKETGKILLVNSDTGDILLRAVNDLPVDAVLMDEGKDSAGSVTWQRLMSMERFAALVSKPALVAVSADVTGEALQMVWETGICGIVVDVSTETEAAAIKDMRKKIEKLNFPAKKKHSELSVTIPHVGASVGAEHEEEPDEDDDDE